MPLVRSCVIILWTTKKGKQYSQCNYGIFLPYHFKISFDIFGLRCVFFPPVSLLCTCKKRNVTEISWLRWSYDFTFRFGLPSSLFGALTLREARAPHSLSSSAPSEGWRCSISSRTSRPWALGSYTGCSHVGRGASFWLLLGRNVAEHVCSSPHLAPLQPWGSQEERAPLFPRAVHTHPVPSDPNALGISLPTGKGDHCCLTESKN